MPEPTPPTTSVDSPLDEALRASGIDPVPAGTVPPPEKGARIPGFGTWDPPEPGGLDTKAAVGAFLRGGRAVALASAHSPAHLRMSSEEVMAALEGRDPVVSARLNLRTVSGTSGDLEAELRAASARTGVPISSARANPDVVRARAAAFTVDDIAARFPSTTKLLADESTARIAHDDIGILTQIESAIGGIASYVMGATPRGGMWADLAAVPANTQKGSAGLGRMALETVAPLFEPTPMYRALGAGNPATEAAAWFGRQAAEAGRRAERIAGTPTGVIEAGVSSGVQSLGQSLAFFATGQPALALAGMAATTGGTSYSHAAEGELPPRSSARA